MNIGIIPDGNRRFARKNKISKEESYEIGLKRVKEIIEVSLDLNIKNLVFYAFSYENFINRSSTEKKIIEKLILKALDSFIEENIYKKVNIFFIGEKEFYSNEIVKKIEKLNNLTNNSKENKKLNVFIAYIYSSKKEIKNLIKKLKDEKEIDDKKIKENLYLPFDLDIIIRTSGEKRLSNFFLYQSAYAELFFIDKYWPEFTKEDFIKIIKEEFPKRKRNFGK